MIKARIENGVVCEVLRADPFPPFAPELEWVECADGVRPGFIFENGEFFPAETKSPSAKDRLAALDAENTLTQRNLRETIMLMAEAFKQVSGGQVDLTQIPGVAKVYEVEGLAEALRSQL